MPAAPPPRSLLFVPGHRPDMVAKVGRWRPDAVVVDLEDAVAAADKDRARDAAVEAVAGLDLPGTQVLVRVNPPGTPWWPDDLAAVAASRAAGAVLPKYDDPGFLEELHRRLTTSQRPDPLVIVGIETVAGVADSRALLAAGPGAAYFGAEDFVADLGGVRTPEGLEVLYARSQVGIAARLAEVPAIDQAVMAIGDEARFRADAEAGRRLGYVGKICIHPSQVALAHALYTPSPEEVAHAERVLAAAAAGVAAVDGEMVDEVHARMARQVLARRR